MCPDRILRDLSKKNSHLILAYQTERLYCREWEFVLDEKEIFWLKAPADPRAITPLDHTNRVAFLLKGSNGRSLTGNAIILRKQNRIGLLPYRLSPLPGKQSYILKFQGWVPETNPSPNMKSFSFWFRAARSRSLLLSAFSVLIGALFALYCGKFNPYLFVLTLCGGVLAHTTANFFSDYHDYINAVDSTQALSSIAGVLALEEVDPTKILTAGFVTLCLALILTSLLTAACGLMPLIFILIGLFGAATYGWKPIAYKYRGWGETIIGLLMGPLTTMGSYFIQTNHLSWPVLLISLSLGMIIFSVSLANNLRDIPEDQRAGITTLPMRLGVYRTKILYYSLIFLPFIFPVLVSLYHPSLILLLMAFFSLPLAWRAASNLAKTQNSIADIRKKAPTLDYPVNSIRYYFSYALWTSIALLISCFIW